MSVEIEYLSGPDIEKLNLSADEILDAVHAGLVAAGQGETVIAPRMHLQHGEEFRGHFNVLRGYVAPLQYAGVKIVGDFVDNYQHGLPSELALLNLFDPVTGMPKAILDASAITDMRTGALRPHIDTGRISVDSFAAEIGEIAAGLEPGRESDDETILFWHRGLSTSDIALGAAMLAKARDLKLVRKLPYR